MLCVLLISAALIAAAVAAFFAITRDAKLDKDKLINYGQTIEFYDAEGQKIQSSAIRNGRSSVRTQELREHTKNAFIASEDRTFYRHNGLNYKRMLKAAFKNIATRSFGEGASTISQQLIKNTHLSNQKTLVRKLKEIRLTKQLERSYTKDEILEMYLNTIYFGHSCYGLQNAARFYFGTDADSLSLAQSATLAGLLSSPNNYSPFKDAEKCVRRRNIVLKSMLDCGFITEAQYREAEASPVGATKEGKNDPKSNYVAAACDELSELGLDSYSQLSGCKVYTCLNAEMQQALYENRPENDYCAVITDCADGVAAYVSTTGGARRQPGSTIKPVLVYAPAIEEGLLHPFTKIDDSPADFGGYAPENHDKKYHGLVTAEESLAKSYNIPAVKTLNALTVGKALEYAQKMDIDADKDDANLALALGGMKYGVSLKNLCDAYSTFRKAGNFAPSHFIERIEDRHGRTIYVHKPSERKVFSRGTCSLMNQMLIQTAKTGTAKKLKNMPFDVAAKTGTCGNAEGNTDAYAAAYTSTHTLCVWLGDVNNRRTTVTGGGACCNIAGAILKKMYVTAGPEPLDTTGGTSKIFIDRQDYEEDGKIILADEISPKLNKMEVRCLAGREPEQRSTKFSRPVIQKPQIKVGKEHVSIVLCHADYYSYMIKRDGKIIYEGKYLLEISDCPDKGSHAYTVIPYYSDGHEKYFGDAVNLERIFFGGDDDGNDRHLPPPITGKDWYN